MTQVTRADKDAFSRGSITHNRCVDTVHYRLAPLVVARFMGLALMLLAVVVFAMTAVIAISGIGWGWLALTVAVGAGAIAVLVWWLRLRAYVVRCTPEGYSVRFVRGAGVKDGRWRDVEDAVAATPHGVQCLVLRLRDGGTTSIPVALLAIDKEEFVREMQRHLGRGQGARPLR